MYKGLQHFHSYWAYLVLIGLAISIIGAIMKSGKAYTNGDRKMALFGLIPAHLQWVLGIILYFVSPLGMQSATGDFMKNPVSRLYAMEHPLMMLLAVILITVGYSRAKRMMGSEKGNKTILMFYTIGLVLILLRIPWISWPGN